MNKIEEDYIDNALTASENYIVALMRIFTESHNFDEKTDFSNIIKSATEMKKFENEFKLSLIATLFTNNYDSLIEIANDEIKARIIKNEPIKRSKSSFSFENGELFEIGTGLKINKINPKIIDNYTKILVLIRNSIAHSKFTLMLDQIHINNRDFEATIDIKWLEMLTLCLFSNDNIIGSESQNLGALIIYNENMSVINNEMQIRSILRESAYLKIKSYNNHDIELEKNEHIFEKMNMNNKIRKRVLIASEMITAKYGNRVSLKLEKINPDFLKMIDNSKLFFYELDEIKHILLGNNNNNYSKICDETYQMQVQILADLHASYNSLERRNTIAYKYILELINLIEKNELKQINIIDSKILLFTNIMHQLLIKTRFNVIFNYMLVKNKNHSVNINSKLKSKYTVPNYVNIRTEKIKKSRDLLNKNIVSIEREKVLKKIDRLLKEIEAYKTKNMDINLLLKEKFRNSFVHDYADFNPCHEIKELIIRDYEDGKQNFKMKIETAEFLELADRVYQEIKNSYQNHQKIKTL